MRNKLYFLYGNDFNAISNRVGNLIGEVKQDNKNQEIKSYQITSSEDFDLFLERESSLNLFSTYICLKVDVNSKGLKAIEKEINRFISVIDYALESKCVIITLRVEKFDKKSKDNLQKSEFYQAIRKSATIEEYILLRHWQENEIKEKIKNCGTKYKLKFTNDALELLVNAYKNDTSAIDRELSRVALYLMPKKDVTKEVVEEFYYSSLNVDDIYNSLISGKCVEFSKLEEDLSSIESPLYLIAVLQAKLREAMHLKVYLENKYLVADIARKIGMHPYRVRLESSKLKSVSVEYLQTLILNLSEIEFKLKNGKISDDVVKDLIFMLPLKVLKC